MGDKGPRCKPRSAGFSLHTLSHGVPLVPIIATCVLLYVFYEFFLLVLTTFIRRKTGIRGRANSLSPKETGKAGMPWVAHLAWDHHGGDPKCTKGRAQRKFLTPRGLSAPESARSAHPSSASSLPTHQTH